MINNMAHYALLDENNVVVYVFPGKNEGDDGLSATDWENFYSAETGKTCKKTSYNTVAGTHRNGGAPFRKNYAGLGYTYDSTRDAFIPPKGNFDSWIFDEDSCCWIPPIPRPHDSAMWDESLKTWTLFDQENNVETIWDDSSKTWTASK
jgi:hypothetical protein